MCVHTDIGGHSDILAGAVTSNSSEFLHELAKVLKELSTRAPPPLRVHVDALPHQVQKIFGAPLAPLESFLLARGLRTLHVRMERHGQNAMKVAQLLDKHPLVDKLFYPGLPS